MRNLLFVAFALLLLSCSNESAPSEQQDQQPSFEVPEGWTQSELHSLEAVVIHPAEWELDTSGKMNTAMILFTPPDSTNDYFRENVNLSWEDISGQGLTIDAYMEKAKVTIQDFVTDLSDFRMEKRNNDYWLSYKGRQGNFQVAYDQRLMLRDEKVYVLNYTSIVSKPSGHDSAAAVVLKRFSLL